MNWDAIGAASEMVGAFAVVITLVYLAIQIRHSAAATQAATAQALADSINASNLLIAGDTAVARIYRIGKFGDWESLTDDEKFQWTHLATAVCQSFQAVLTHHRLKQADEMSVELAKNTLRSIFSAEAYKRWWSDGHGKLPFTPDFVKFIEHECL
jgi:hypothetical protein